MFRPLAGILATLLLAAPVAAQAPPLATPVAAQAPPLATPVAAQAPPLATPVGGQGSPLATPVGGQGSPLAAPVGGQAPPVGLDLVTRADGARVVPDRFLRRWDPVTVLFERDTGPATGPEDAPERFVTMQPPIAGEWQWLGPRALQFRPTEPWQPLRRVTLGIGAATTALVPLLPAPIATSPAAEEEAGPALDTILLTFPDPVEPTALTRLLTLEVRPLPGTATPEAERLADGDFRVLPMERASREAPATYRILLNRPIPDGRVVILRLALADMAGLDAEGFALRLRTAVPFAVTDLGCGRGLAREMVDGLLRCAAPQGDAIAHSLALRFSAEAPAPGIIAARQALRFTPPVDDLRVTGDGRTWRIAGRFQADTAYTLVLDPGAVRDGRDRALASVPPPWRFAFEAARPALRWEASQGLAERLGPQMVPLRGQGYDRADIRIHRIDPLGRDFWPFPAAGLTSEDDVAPPLPGNEPAPWSGAEALRRNAMVARLRALGSPAVSELLPLPLRRGAGETRFGIDAAPLLARIAGPGQPGTYLLGLRAVDGATRRWLRLQVTDLVLTTVEEPERVRFAVTSLATATPVDGAEIRLEGLAGDSFTTLLSGVTGGDGFFTWTAPTGAAQQRLRRELRRIVVAKGNDTLVLEPQRNPRVYAAEGWTRAEEPWLGWTQADAAERREVPRLLCHVFTERPIYRPEDPIHIQGFVRRYGGGDLAFARSRGRIAIDGPDGAHWDIDVTPDASGGFHHLFAQQTDATGEYTLRFIAEGGDAEGCGAVTIRKEAYRLPSFEVLLNTPGAADARVPLDAPFGVELLARYFAGGLAAGRPVTWRVRQFPEPWSPPGRAGFRFSTDSRFSGQREFRSSPVLTREAQTDDAGAARLDLDPSIEPTAQPRRYVVEATVTGDDDIQVRAVQNVVALPPFVLGLNLPRYVAAPGEITGEALVADATGRALPGIAYTATLIRRRWNSVLQASDFAAGAARYATEMIEEVAETRSLTSAAQPEPLRFAATEAGVYVVELVAEDRLGRRQAMRVDLFMAGGTPVTWARPPAETVTLATDRDAYAPGETATLLIQSPWQTARALVVTEEPEGRFRYDWTEVSNGVGRIAVPIRKAQMPRLAVHVLLMRGRVPGTAPGAAAPIDLGRPVTLAATRMIAVTPVQHRVNVALEAPPTARPGQVVEVVLRLSDEAGRPLAGEAAFWLVDQAVLTLAREQPLDPLPSFIVERPVRIAARDTRHMAFGLIPLQENPGGDEATAEQWGQENISVRRNFTPVPIYLPRVVVGADGTARIRVPLPDTLTMFRMRAKAISGPARFGAGGGEIRVRQALVAQPALPRFLRPGDRFDAAFIGRVVEGPLGAGQARLSAPGLLAAPTTREVTFAANRPVRIGIPLTVPQDAAGEARLNFQLRRPADGATDAVEVTLPIQPDRAPVLERLAAVVEAGAGADLAGPAQAPRPGSYRGMLTLAADPVLARLVGGMDGLLAATAASTEQRIALAWTEVALARFAPLLAATGIEGRLGADLRLAQRAIQQATDADGLVAFWPRGRGSVFLTAAALRFLAAADAAGQPIDTALRDRLAEVLVRALRSDYPLLLAGEELRERVAALVALAEAGRLQPAYTAELARRAAQMPTETLAQAGAAIALLPEDGRALLPGLLETLWGRVRLAQRDGRPVYGGLSETGGNPLILPSETRSLAEVVLAVARAAPADPRLPVLRDGLLRLGGPDGFGGSNATGAALRALGTSWAPPGTVLAVRAALPDGARQGRLDAATPLLRFPVTQPGGARIENAGAAPAQALLEHRYTPVQPGATAAATQAGFVLSTTLFRVRADAPPERLVPGQEGAHQVAAGDIVELAAEIVNPEDRVHVVLTLPIAAGFEPLNPALATAPAITTPATPPTPQPDWVRQADDSVTAAYVILPAGNHRFAVRLRAQVPGSFTQPPAEVAALYRPDLRGTAAGTRIVVAPPP